MTGRLAALSVDLDEITNYARIHGLARDDESHHPVYDLALPRVADFAKANAVPLTLFAGAPERIRSCWIFVIRAGAATGAERHPNSHQRSCSLLGSGTFEVHDGKAWHLHALTPAGDVDRRWVSIPPSTWHRLRVGPSEWGMVSFHTVVARDLIEENPLDPDRLDGSTRQERYAGRR